MRNFKGWILIILLSGCDNAAVTPPPPNEERAFEKTAAALESSTRAASSDEETKTRSREREDAPRDAPKSKEEAWARKCGEPRPSEQGYVDVTFDGMTSRYLYGGTLGTFSSGACCGACASLREGRFSLRASKSADLARESLYIDAGGVTFWDAEGRIWSGGNHALGERDYGKRLEGTVELVLGLRGPDSTKRLPESGTEKTLKVQFSLPREAP